MMGLQSTIRTGSGEGLLLRFYENKNDAIAEINPPSGYSGVTFSTGTTLASTDDKVAEGFPAHSTIYEFDSKTPLTSDSPLLTEDPHSKVVNQQIYRIISEHSREGLETTHVPPKAIVVTVYIEPKPEILEDFASWYNEEHILLLSMAAGWRSCKRYELVGSIGKENAERRFLAIHYWDEVNGLGGPEWKRSVETEWTAKIRKGSVYPHHIRRWTVVDQKACK